MWTMYTFIERLKSFHTKKDHPTNKMIVQPTQNSYKLHIKTKVVFSVNDNATGKAYRKTTIFRL